MYKDVIIIRKRPSHTFEQGKAYLAEIEQDDMYPYNIDAMIYDEASDYWEDTAYSSFESMREFWYGI